MGFITIDGIKVYINKDYQKLGIEIMRNIKNIRNKVEKSSINNNTLVNKVNHKVLFYKELQKLQLNISVEKVQLKGIGFKARNAEAIQIALKNAIVKTNSSLMLKCKTSVDYKLNIVTVEVILTNGIYSEISSFSSPIVALKLGNIAQQIGATASYCKKYALQDLLCIDDGIDVDNYINTQDGMIEPALALENKKDVNRNYLNEKQAYFKQLIVKYGNKIGDMDKAKNDILTVNKFNKVSDMSNLDIDNLIAKYKTVLGL